MDCTLGGHAPGGVKNARGAGSTHLMVLAVATWVAVAAYVVGWSVIPVMDRLALTASAVSQPALSVTVLTLAALMTATYVLIFTDGPGDAIGVAAHSPYTLASAALTTAVTLAYFRVLNDGGMITVVMLQPALLIAQIGLAAAVLKEPVDRWNAAGVAVAAAGMVLFNGDAIGGWFRRSREQV